MRRFVFGLSFSSIRRSNKPNAEKVVRVIDSHKPTKPKKQGLMERLKNKYDEKVLQKYHEMNPIVKTIGKLLLTFIALNGFYRIALRKDSELKVRFPDRRLKAYNNHEMDLKQMNNPSFYKEFPYVIITNPAPSWFLSKYRSFDMATLHEFGREKYVPPKELNTSNQNTNKEIKK